MNKIQMPTDVSIVTTYRCPMRCKMCNIWQYPTYKKKEIRAGDLDMLPNFKFVNITGGEPFIRDDLEEIVEVMLKKSSRVVISTSGWYYDKIISMVKRFPKIGIRVSIEGLKKTNDFLRGCNGGYENGIKLLKELKRMGIKDIGFGITISNHNSEDMLELYKISKDMKIEFATATFHNSDYFHKYDNRITYKYTVNKNLITLINRLLGEKNPKSWFRAFFNLGLINYINGGRRMLPCEAGNVNFFIAPYGDVFPCNGSENKLWKQSMGNIREVKSFEELWYSDDANKAREYVEKCPKNCWMIGTAAPVMKKYIACTLGWVVKNKIRNFLGKPALTNTPYYNVGQNSLQGDLNFSRINEH